MPEGHSVHRIANLLRELFLDHEVAASSPQGRFREGAALVSGSTILGIEAIGKQLFIQWEKERWLRVHLGIYGAWDIATRDSLRGLSGVSSRRSLGAPRVRKMGKHDAPREALEVFPPEPVGQVRLRLQTDDALADLRGPTVCEVLSPDEVDSVRARLGPDPVYDKGRKGADVFASRVGKTTRPIGIVLMDQSVVSGIGNVYRAELLFRHRMDPFRRAHTLDRSEIDALWRDWSALLADGIATGVMMTRNDLTKSQRVVALENTQERYFVYRRHGQPCRVCGTPIVMAEMAARKLYLCPNCQKSTGSVS